MLPTSQNSQIMRPPGSEGVAGKAPAFSLVEMLLVMAVTGTLLARARPS